MSTDEELHARIREAIKRDAIKTGDTFVVDGVRYLMGAGSYSVFPEGETVGVPAIGSPEVDLIAVRDGRAGPRRRSGDDWVKLGVIDNLEHDGPILRVEAYWEDGSRRGVRLKIMVPSGVFVEDGFVHTFPTAEVVREWLDQAEKLAVKAGFMITLTSETLRDLAAYERIKTEERYPFGRAEVRTQFGDDLTEESLALIERVEENVAFQKQGWITRMGQFEPFDPDLSEKLRQQNWDSIPLRFMSVPRDRVLVREVKAGDKLLTCDAEPKHVATVTSGAVLYYGGTAVVGVEWEPGAQRQGPLMLWPTQPYGMEWIRWEPGLPEPTLLEDMTRLAHDFAGMFGDGTPQSWIINHVKLDEGTAHEFFSKFVVGLCHPYRDRAYPAGSVGFESEREDKLSYPKG